MEKLFIFHLYACSSTKGRFYTFFFSWLLKYVFQHAFVLIILPNIYNKKVKKFNFWVCISRGDVTILFFLVVFKRNITHCSSVEDQSLSPTVRTTNVKQHWPRSVLVRVVLLDWSVKKTRLRWCASLFSMAPSSILVMSLLSSLGVELPKKVSHSFSGIPKSGFVSSLRSEF